LAWTEDVRTARQVSYQRLQDYLVFKLSLQPMKQVNNNRKKIKNNKKNNKKLKKNRKGKISMKLERKL